MEISRVFKITWQEDAERKRGLYVSPVSASEWHGILYVSAGIYEGGVFAFKARRCSPHSTP
jgi:hypothetical protein